MYLAVWVLKGSKGRNQRKVPAVEGRDAWTLVCLKGGSEEGCLYVRKSHFESEVKIFLSEEKTTLFRQDVR